MKELFLLNNAARYFFWHIKYIAENITTAKVRGKGRKGAANNSNATPYVLPYSLFLSEIFKQKPLYGRSINGRIMPIKSETRV